MWIKRLIFALVALIIISVVGVAVFLLTFDPNAYKGKLEEFVYQRYERQLTIDGPIQLSLFPRIGLSLQDVHLSEQGSTAPFAAVDTMRFSVAVWPLLWNRLVIDHLSLDGVEAWVEVDADQFTDWLDYDPAQERAEGPLPVARVNKKPVQTGADGSNSPWPLLRNALAQPLEDAVLPRLERSEFQIDIAGLDIQGVRVNVFDRGRSWIAELNDLSLNTGRVTLEQPFDLSLKGKVYSQQLGLDMQYEGQGVLQIEPTLRRLTVHRSQLQFAGQADDYAVQRGTLRTALQYQLQQSLYLEQFDLSTVGRWAQQAEEESTQFSLTASSIGAYFLQPEFWLEKLQLNGQLQNNDQRIEFGLDIPDLKMGQQHTEAQPVSASLRYAQDEEVFGLNIHLDDFAKGWQALEVNRFNAEGRYQHPEQSWQVQLQSAVQWEHEARQLFFADLAGTIGLEDQSLAEGFSGRSLGGNFYIEPFNGHAAGELYGQRWERDQAVTNAVDEQDFNERLDWFLWFDKHNRPARLITHLEAKVLDLNDWLPWAEASSAKHHEDADIEQEEDDASEHKDRATLAARPLPETEWRWFALPIDWSWRIEAEQFHFRQIWLEQFQVYGQWRQKALEVSELQALLHEGSLKAHLSWLDSDQFQGYLSLHEVDSAALLAGLGWQPFLQGQTNLEATWYTRGTTPAAWLAQLYTEAQLTIEEGAFIGYSLLGQVDAANEVLRHLFAGQVPPMPEDYDAQYNTPFEKATAEIHGANGQLQFQELALSGPEYQLSGKQPAWVDLINQQLDINLALDLHIDQIRDNPQHRIDFAQARIPMRLTGSLWAPELRMQWSDMRHRFVREAIHEGLLDVLGLPVYVPLGDESPPDGEERTMMESLVEDTAKYFGATLKEFLQRID